ncbi:MAG: hypothetical protein KY442_04255 [Proteobacteria bacterium]|nr:hypothetical protein [Pseudomonadota bacterium]
MSAPAWLGRVVRVGFLLLALLLLALALRDSGDEALAAARDVGLGNALGSLVAVLVGLAQVVAGVFPGTSRSAAAIFMAMLAGTGKRSAATEFVFLVGIPTMFAASGYALLEHFLGAGASQEAWGEMALAFAAATATGFIAVRWLLGYIKRHSYTPFAIYRIVLGVGLLLWLPAGG